MGFSFRTSPSSSQFNSITDMDNIKAFLESSSIHGLAYISTTKKCVKLLWILVITTGFIGAGALIHSAFKSWADSPVVTTIETLPISEITFPKVTVCPPRNSYTNLNYDMTKNRSLTKEARTELSNQAQDLLQQHMFNTILENLDKIEVKDRYYNWYHGYDWIYVPGKYSKYYDVHSIVYTHAKSGSIGTKYFGESFKADQVELSLESEVVVFIPHDSNKTIICHIDIEREPMKDLSSGFEHFYVNHKKISTERKKIRMTLNSTIQAHMPMKLQRKVSLEDVKSLSLNKMPGLLVTWYVTTGMDNSDPYYEEIKNKVTVEFVRNISKQILIFWTASP